MQRRCGRWASSASGSGSGSGSGSSSSSSSSLDGDHRRLGGEASIVIINTGFMVVSAGIVAFIMNAIRMPLVLGYILGGVLVGPQCLGIVESYESIKEMSKLGLILLLFMTGLEMDCGHLFSMGKVVWATGSLQFPLSGGIMTGIFMGLEKLGVSFGSGEYAALYCGATTAISSTMIVIKWLTIEHDMDSVAGRLTMGILHFQDIWVMVMLAFQPHLTNPDIVGMLRTVVSVVLLIAICIKYAKYVMPAVMMMSKGSVELMMEEDLTWCFLIGCFATLPFIGLSFEVAALVAGVALATFPFCSDVSGKVKYIEDFFITLFFGGLGMQLTVPTMAELGTALIIVVVVLLVRWIGLFPLLDFFDGGPRLATVVSLNLSQISELALVICSLGLARGHVEKDTLTILILAFAILAALSGPMIGYNYQIYGFFQRHLAVDFAWMKKAGGNTVDTHTDDGDHADRNIVFLGFHKVSALLLAHFEHYSPAMLGKIHVIDYHEHIMEEIRKRGVTCAYGDISNPEVLEHAHHGDVRLVISSVSDVLLRDVTNLQILRNAKKVWPSADVIVTATTQEEANILYENGADYVIRMTKLCAERLHDLMVDHSTHHAHHQHVNEETKLSHVFAHYQKAERHITKENSLIHRVAHSLA
jgi:Kef-type K+ transport system membrane component KefB